MTSTDYGGFEDLDVSFRVPRIGEPVGAKTAASASASAKIRLVAPIP
ncbi:MAG: hypothetical protein HYY32_03390 [Chloroflexi bacterium]|nr:hypothetical protein [Chloroflexota bacterium]